VGPFISDTCFNFNHVRHLARDALPSETFFSLFFFLLLSLMSVLQLLTLLPFKAFLSSEIIAEMLVHFTKIYGTAALYLLMTRRLRTSYRKSSKSSGGIVLLICTVRSFLNDSDLTVINSLVHQNSCLKFSTAVVISLRRSPHKKYLQRILIIKTNQWLWRRCCTTSNVLSQLGNMYNEMKSETSWQRQSVLNSTDSFFNLKRSIKIWRKLLIMSSGYWICLYGCNLR
jgi:hypothetical protein